MSRRRLTISLVVIAVLAVVAFLLWPRGDASRAPSQPLPTRAAPTKTPPPEAAAPEVELAGPLTLSPATVVAAPDAAAGELAGRVLNWGDGSPVAGAEVSIAPEDGARTSSFTTGRDGTFVVRPPAPGRYRVVSALAAGYLPWAPDPGASPLELVARPGVRVDGVVLYLVPAIEYHGTVVDPDGAPVAGATVVLLDAAAGERAQAPIADTFTSGPDGGFTFHAPDYALFEARKDGFAPGRAVLDAAVMTSREMTIRLGARGGAAPPEHTIAGIVVDADGNPVPGARVVASPDRGAETMRTGEAQTGDDGRFTIDGVDAGMHGVRAIARGHATAAVLALAGAKDVRIELGVSASIAGRVVDPDGKAVPAATIAVLQPAGLVDRVVAVSSVFDAEGRFTIEDIAPGDYFVVAQAHGFAPSTKTAATAKRDPAEVTVAVRRGATLVGTMIDGESKQPLGNGKVTVEGALGEGSSAIPLVTTAITRDDGGFELAGIAPGRRSISAGAFGHHMAIVGPLDVTEGARLGPITIELSPTAPGETPRIELAGIGAALAADGDALRVNQVFPGSGAEAAGIVVGDAILAIDGTPVTSLGLEGAIGVIRGPVGTKVVLRIRRASGESDVSVTRTKIRA
jgi:hypothetical protein